MIFPSQRSQNSSLQTLVGVRGKTEWESGFARARITAVRREINGNLDIFGVPRCKIGSWPIAVLGISTIHPNTVIHFLRYHSASKVNVCLDACPHTSLELIPRDAHQAGIYLDSCCVRAASQSQKRPLSFTPCYHHGTDGPKTLSPGRHRRSV